MEKETNKLAAEVGIFFLFELDERKSRLSCRLKQRRKITALRAKEGLIFEGLPTKL